ncbi:hypothetical protein GLOTRDRAFT_115492 [Gloeophyllum trabeum ATCC 11539]|uniref:Uncharacterized protein n=1 Tax=Gloeophyllum trabeum (strain ATCC 11539 / FP-39264 / Madison 617) TaxID=670483 RepID=S7QCR7_GLOTA|nr:uncharacterized protein GLOTRDRAFT_115492 [Gloeophyllum trabeum ATCC 11539]EPQ57671.1 hypothetical protein GLOTRDRAFT_115492 [Gloeophyllum trabeum ATCC 11539]
MSEDTLLSHFTVLDDLIQVIYQGHLKFVVLSEADEDSGWCVHVGLTSRNKEGRWWRGRWTEGDVEKIIGSKKAMKVAEGLAQELKDAITSGFLSISNWSSSPGAEIDLTLSPTNKQQHSVSLTELSAAEAAAHAADVFFRIALQAQKRGCQLEPSAAPALPLPTFEPTRTKTLLNVATASGAPSKSPRRVEPSSSMSSMVDPETAKEIEQLKTRLAHAEAENAKGQKKPDGKFEAKLKARGVAAPRPPKGSSLANPNKRARKITKLEFEDSD